MNKCAHCSAIQVRDWEIGTTHGNCTNCQSLLESEGLPEWEPPPALLRAVRRELTASFPDISFVKLVTDDLGFSVEDLEAEKFASVEMMWKWLINLVVDSGPAKVVEFAGEIMERASTGMNLDGVQQLRAEANGLLPPVLAAASNHTETE